MNATEDHYRIGLVIGGGVGAQLADVFQKAVTAFAAASNRVVEIDTCPHRPMSFTEMKHWTASEFEQAVNRDVEHLDDYYRSVANRRGRVSLIHRTAVNAEALYQLRRRLGAVKLIRMDVRGVRLLMARDQTQGFYANDAWSIEEGRVSFSGSFERSRVELVLNAAREEGRGWLRDSARTWLVFKHHLFANVFVRWAQEIGGIDEVQQPGAAYMLLMRHLAAKGGDLLIVGSNEIIDLLHEVLLSEGGIEARETGIARNVFLSAGARHLIEYQTVHGSADDLTGTERVNPIATIRSAAAIMERELRAGDWASALEIAIRSAVRGSLLTPTLELRCATTALVDALVTGSIANMGRKAS